MNTTEWRTVAGSCDLYEINRAGQVRRKATEHTPAGKPLAPNPDRRGYIRAHLSLPEGRQKSLKVHRALLEAFVGPPPSPGMFALHADDNPANNDLSNLRWGTRRENIEDAMRNGGLVAGAAWRRAITHCPRGHAYDEKNTRIKRTGRHERRVCRACHREDARRRRLERA